MTPENPGYEAEQHELAALVAAVVGDRAVDEQPAAWFAYLSSRQALLAGAASAVGRMRDTVVLDMLNGATERAVAEQLGLTHGRVHQIKARAAVWYGGVVDD
jgi:phage gp37-like protein